MVYNSSERRLVRIVAFFISIEADTRGRVPPSRGASIQRR